ncbi:MAG: hypothetical protein M1818_008415 [Claussenomyces sp. TS43310]|nr:MAG: hypothetical protein M1818_008415 [Claussenomyces sp. TS43310]
MSAQDKVAALSSLALRLLAYVFLRWIPGDGLPKVIYTLFAIYVPSFIASFLTQPQYNVLADEVDVTVTDVEVEDQPLPLASTAAHSRNLRSRDKPNRTEEVIDVEETLTLEKKSPKAWRTLITGIPSPTSAFLSLLTLAINVALIVFVTDFVYRRPTLYPSHDLAFARLGYVSDTEAKLLIREPDQSKLPLFVSVKIKEPKPPFDMVGWQSAGGINYLSNDTDYTAVVTIPLRQGQDTAYEWVTSNNFSGSFDGAPRPGHTLEKNDGKFTFLTSSCIIPHFPYNPTDHPLSLPGLKHLGKVLPSLGAQFMLFLGDFIYIDVPKRFGTTIEDYRREYRQVYASPDWPLVSQNLSWIHVLDDHEISNDYDDGNSTNVYQAARDPWTHYHVAANPPRARQAGIFNGPRNDATYFQFTQGPASFFMLDTRTYRDKARDLPSNSTEKTMLGKEQLSDLIAFLERPAERGIKWKIVASSIPFTQNWKINSMDTWAGYLGERQKILEAMWDVAQQGVGVVVLSGDRHEFAATAFPPPAGEHFQGALNVAWRLIITIGSKWPISATVHEFSTSPLSQFYLPTPTYWETGEDIMIKYIPWGNSKFGVVAIESPKGSDQSILKFRLFIDGDEAWSSVLLSPPSAGKNRRKDALWG